jgi:hypothetical protein
MLEVPELLKRDLDPMDDVRHKFELSYIEIRLGGSSLLGAYNDVAKQVNAINSVDPYRIGIPLMQSAPLKVEATAS